MKTSGKTLGGLKGRNRVAQGKSATADAALGYVFPNTSIPGGAKADLPSEWVLTRIGDIASSIQYGHTASANTSDGPRFLRITDIQNGTVNWDSVPSCDIDRADIPKYQLAEGDLVFARTGATTGKSFLIGKCPEAVFASYLIRVRIQKSVLPQYVSFFFQSSNYWRQIEAGKRGIGQPNVNAQILRNIRIPLAPLLVQRRIVAEIEKQFTRLDAGVAALKRVQANLKRYRASVLKAACEGRLVPTEAELARAEGRSYEPADVLLQRILKERREKWTGKGKYREPAAPDTIKLPKLPEGWCWGMVEQLAEVRSGQTAKRADDFVTPDGMYPWFKVGDMNAKGNEHFMRIARTGFTEEAREQLGLSPMPVGTIIFPKRGGAIATNKKRLLIKPSCCDLNTMGVIPNGDIAAYLWWWLAGIDLARLSDGSNVPQINHQDINPLCVPIPPFGEQEWIVTEVERRLSLVDELEEAVSANLHRADRLRQSILQQAFTGELLR